MVRIHSQGPIRCYSITDNYTYRGVHAILSSMALSRIEAGRLGGLQTAKTWRARYEQAPKICPWCSNNLPYEKRHNKYCNHSCAASRNNQGLIRNGLAITLRQCLFCNQETKNKKCCSHLCSNRYQREKNAQNAFIGCGPQQVRHYLIDTRGHKCERCNRKTWQEQDIPIEVEHVNGNHTDNQLGNLKLLCMNCHGLTPTFRAKNKGNGRHSRRQRYKEGKSF